MIEFRHKIILYLLVVTVFLTACPQISAARTARGIYAEAEACYHKLRSSSQRQKYRDQWLRCIDKFDAVYRHDPSGPWAAAGLYMSGELYRELYRRSYKPSDKKEALDIYERIIKRFPSSRYGKKAGAAIQGFSEPAKSRPAVSKAPEPKTDSAKAKYVEAEACYQKLRGSLQRQKYRDQWLRCIDKFDAVYRHDPSGPWAAAGLYMSGELYRELYRRSYRSSDREAALDIFRRTREGFPKSAYRNRAARALSAFSPPQNRRAPSQTPEPKTPENPNPADEIEAKIKESASAPKPVADQGGAPVGETVIVSGLRFWSNPSYTRIVIDADSETTFSHRLLKKDPLINKPQRLYVDLDKCRLAGDIERVIPINDNLLTDARAGQYAPDSVRVVVDIKSFKTYKIFSLKNPFRIVIDVWGKETAPAPIAAGASPRDGKVPPGALAKQLALGVRRIVIDPGHGGRDYGAPGYLKGVHEKHVVLKIARRLAQKIREELGCEVFMTRKTDRHLTLEERTAIANTQNADLFISIHTNAARDRRAYGIETFFLNLATDEDAIRVAARENATSTKNISDLQAILSDLMQNSKINESSRLAVNVQAAMHENLKRQYSRIKNKGVKQAPFYVLLGAQMPAILIETAFISNARECKRLINAKYQDKMCESIVDGIREYIKEINPSTVFKTSPAKNIEG